MSPQFDIVVWGATGFTGQLVSKYIFEHYPDLSWAVAGRSESKLQKVVESLKSIERKGRRDLPEILIGNANDSVSVEDVVSQAKVVISCVGPYANYGEPVVAACVKHGANYVDITGESQFVQEMIDKYHEKAKAKGIKIISQCGFDSIPSDLGTYFLSKHVKKESKSGLWLVRAFVDASGAVSGGTIESAFGIVTQSLDDLKRLFLNPNYLYAKSERGGTENFTILDAPQFLPWFETDQWFGSAFNPLGWPNTLIVRRSNRFFKDTKEGAYGKEFHYQERLKTKFLGLIESFFIFFFFMFFGLLLSVKSLRNTIRSLLPAPGQGPSEKVMNNGYFKVLLVGHTENGKTVKARVSLANHDPGYKGTALMLAESGLCLALDTDKLGKESGCLTPAFAMGETLITRLMKAGLKFEILK